MTGTGVKWQVEEALDLAVRDYGSQSEGEGCSLARAALAPCVVLTREEAEAIKQGDITLEEMDALLSPDEAGDVEA